MRASLKLIVSLSLLLSPVAFAPPTAHADVGAEEDVYGERIVRIWDAATGRPAAPANWQSGTDEASALAFSPDGKMLASNHLRRNEDKDKLTNTVVALADLAQGTHRVLNHDAPVTALAFSRPDGKYLATGTEDKAVRLWKLDTQEVPSPIKDHPAAIDSLAFSPDGRLLAVAAGDIVKLWDVSDPAAPKNPRVLSGNARGIYTVAFSPDGRFVAGAGGDGAVRLWEVADNAKKLAHTLVGHKGVVNSVAFAARGTTLASGGDDGTVKLWDTSAAQPQARTLAGHASSVTSLSFTADGTRLLSGGWDANVRVWDVASETATNTIRAHRNRVSAVAFAPDGSRFATGTLPADASASGLHIIALGVSNYQGPLAPLPAAASDAQAVADAFEQNGKWVFQHVNKQVILDSQATVASLDAAFDNVRRNAAPNDTFIFFFSGHSAAAGEPKPEGYLLTSSVSDPSNAEALARDAVSAAKLQSWLAGMGTRKQLVMLNSAEESRTYDAFWKRLIGEAPPEMRTREVALLSLDHRAQTAADGPRKGFATIIQQALDGRANVLKIKDRVDDRISVRELEAYLIPTAFSFGQKARLDSLGAGDFDLGYLTEVAKGRRRRPKPKPELARSARRKVKPVGKYYALLIATRDYDPGSGWDDLENPIRDAETVAGQLQNYGFEPDAIDILPNPTLDQLMNKFLEYAPDEYGVTPKGLKPEDSLFIFISGHGDKDNTWKDGYIVPSNAKPNDQGRRSYLAFSAVRGLIDNITAEHVFVILDTCHGGWFDGSGKPKGMLSPLPYEDDEESYYQRAMSLKSRMYIAAAGDGYASDGLPGDPHSPFVRDLLKVLESNEEPRSILTVGEIWEAVKIATTPRASGIFGKHDKHAEFVFVAK